MRGNLAAGKAVEREAARHILMAALRRPLVFCGEAKAEFAVLAFPNPLPARDDAVFAPSMGKGARVNRAHLITRSWASR